LISILVKGDKMEIVTFASELTIIKASKGASLSLLKKDNEFKNSVKAIMLMLSDVANYLELKYNDDIAIDVAVNITTKYFYFRLEDILLCFTRGKRGDYGKIFHKTITLIVADWLSAYDTQHEGEFTQIAESSKKVYGSNERTNAVVTFKDLATESEEFYNGFKKGAEKERKKNENKDK
jgi:hypothetical protein